MRKITITFMLFLVVILLAANGNAQGYETKDQWAAKIKQDHRITRHLCAPDSHMITCTSEYTDEENGQSVTKKIDVASCTEAVDIYTEAMLHDGKNDNKPAMFYHKLPANIGAGHQMNEYASLLGKEIFTSIYGLLIQKGGTIIQTPECNEKLLRQAQIDGN